MAKYFAMFLSIWELALYVMEMAAHPESTYTVCINLFIITMWISLTIDIYRLQPTTDHRE